MIDSGDFISREEAFNAILKLVPKVDDDGYCWVIRGDAAMAIYSIPAADVRPVVRGKWVDDWETGCSECSACHDGFLWEDYDGVDEWHYCPQCGADMRPEPPKEDA